MKHTTLISRRSVRTASSFCDNIESDYQAMLCFMLQVLTGFFLPLANIKKPTDPDSYDSNTTDTNTASA